MTWLAFFTEILLIRHVIGVVLSIGYCLGISGSFVSSSIRLSFDFGFSGVFQVHCCTDVIGTYAGSCSCISIFLS